MDFDATWNSQNVVLDTANDLVSMTHKKGDDSVKLFRNVGGTAGDYVNSVTFKTHTFDGTQADFQWRNSGASGYGYFAYNSSGKLRYYHSDGSNSKGKLFNGFDLGAGEGDTIRLKSA
ncbi:MAG: hypothetical protein HRT88_16165, partial [Lentisphaeraceae bacterium]|nr:hypothetical protein [Lentisphaeraceae bacterium]